MADGIQSTVEVDQPTAPNINSQLEYPQLLIEASFESLLSHSHSSGSRITIPMPHSERSLGESWSSLSEHDLTHDDDLTSEVTDTGSLIDVSNTEDIQSVDGQGQSDDTDEDDQQRRHQLNDHADTFESGEIRSGRSIQDTQSQYTDMLSFGPIKLDSSTIVIDSSGATSLQASKTFSDMATTSYSSRVDLERSSEDLMVTIKMSMATEGLKLRERPYNVLYYGSEFASSEIKAEVLGKIGAALISSSDHLKLDGSMEPPCYHVVPSEFGPGSQPSTAELIPIPTQMHVTDCTVPDILTNQNDTTSIRLQLSTGRSVVSRRASFLGTSTTPQWAVPDLVVVIVSQHENQESRSKAQKIVEFADRHGIALLCLRQEGGWQDDDFLTDASPEMLHKVVQSLSEYESSELGRKMLIDVDMFRLLDTEQLSQHINHLTTVTSRSGKSFPGLGLVLRTQIRNGCRYLWRSISSYPSQNVPASSEHTRSSDWIIETLPSQTSAHQYRKKQKRYSGSTLALDDLALMFAGPSRALLVICVTSLAMAFFYTFFTGLPYRMTARTSDLQSIPGSQLDVIDATQHLTTTSVSTATTVVTQAYALSGPLQALEQQVQSWMAVNVPGGRKKEERESREARIEKHDTQNSITCLDVASAHISPNLKVDRAFFTSGEPSFKVEIRRGGERVNAKVERQADNIAAVMIKRKDLYGHLTIHLEGPRETFCATVNLENSVSEALTRWIKRFDERKMKLRTAKELANKYTRLVEVRAPKPGFVNSALELHYSAVEGIGAAVEAVEKSVIKQAKVCQQGKDECLLPTFEFAKDISNSVQLARRTSEQLIQNARDQITETAMQARNRANEATQQAREEVLKAVEAVQSSFKDLTAWKNIWPSGVANKLAKAQGRAQVLVEKSRKGRRDVVCEGEF